MRIYIGCDSTALDLKKAIINTLLEKNIPYHDVGVLLPSDDTPYPLIAKKVADLIIQSDYEDQGILLCGTGIGMAIAANKFKGIYAAVCHDIFSTERAKLSNSCNVLTMGARVIAPELAKRLVSEWLSLEFKQGPSSAKIETIKEIETANFK